MIDSDYDPIYISVETYSTVPSIAFFHCLYFIFCEVLNEIDVIISLTAEATSPNLVGRLMIQSIIGKTNMIELPLFIFTIDMGN